MMTANNSIENLGEQALLWYLTVRREFNSNNNSNNPDYYHLFGLLPNRNFPKGVSKTRVYVLF